jgi:hypothetical protein
VRTLTVSLARTTAETPRRPCEAIRIKIAPVHSGGVDDRLVNLPALGMNRVAGDPGQLRCTCNGGEGLLGVSLRMLVVFVPRVFDLVRRERERGERLCDRHRGDFGTDLLGESDTVLNRLGGEVRPVGRDQYILVQGSPPPSHLRGISSSH